MSSKKDRKRRITSRELAVADLQLFAVTLLLMTPSRLQESWVKSEASADWKQTLTELGFVDVTKALKLMSRLKNRRMFFEGVGTLLREMREEYPEPPPHPARKVDVEIVRRLGPNPCG